MKIRLQAEGFDLGAELDKYTNRKVLRLVRLTPRKDKSEASCVVLFKRKEVKGVKHCTCIIDFTLEGETLTAEETTQHMYAALDIAIVRVEQQLKDYLGKHKTGLLRSRLKRLHS